MPPKWGYNFWLNGSAGNPWLTSLDRRIIPGGGALPRFVSSNIAERPDQAAERDSRASRVLGRALSYSGLRPEGAETKQRSDRNKEPDAHRRRIIAVHSDVPFVTMPAPAPHPVLAAAGVTKRFGSNQALAGVTLNLQAGECLGLLGPNGAGKSTFVRTIVRRVIPDAGTVTMLGHDAGSPSARALIGYVPQEIALYPLMSVRENLLVFGRYQKLTPGELNAAIVWALEWAALHDRKEERVKALSGGMKRRLNMAAGLLHRPRIVLLDEPTVGVDPQSRERIYAMITGLRDEGVSLIYTTHYMEEAERLCDRIAIIDHGRIIAEGTRNQLVQASFGTEADLAVTLSDVSADAAAWLAARGARFADGVARFRVANPASDVAEVLAALRDRNLAVQDLSLRQPNLESVFLHLTGRELRE